MHLQSLASVAVVFASATSANADDAEWVRRSSGVTIELLAAGTDAGVVWMAGEPPRDPALASWVPTSKRDVHVVKGLHVDEGKKVGVLFRVTAPEKDAPSLSYVPEMKRLNYSVGRGSFKLGYPTVPVGQRLDALSFRVPAADQTQITIEALCASGPWDRVADVAARKNSSSTTSIRDGGRHGVALMNSAGYDDRGLSAVASLALRDSERLEESYRLVAIDDAGEVLASTERFSNGGYVGQLMLQCPPEMTMPAKFQLQQRPKNPVVFKDIPLERPAE